MLDDNGEQIALVKQVEKAHPLAGMLDRITPDAGIPEPVHEIPVQFPAYVLDSAVCPDDERLLEIRLATLRL